MENTDKGVRMLSWINLPYAEGSRNTEKSLGLITRGKEIAVVTWIPRVRFRAFTPKMVLLLFTGTSVTQGWIFTFASHSDVLRILEGGPVSDDCQDSTRAGHFTTHSLTHSLTWASLSHAKSLCHLSGFEKWWGLFKSVMYIGSYPRGWED